MEKNKLSARFIMAVIFTVTYCGVMFGCTLAMLQKTIPMDTYIAVLATFALIVREITDAYFKREDRKKEGNDNA